MPTDLATRDNSQIAAVLEQVIAAGDLDKLTPQQRASYLLQTCTSLGLNPLTQPFQYIRLQGKLTLYARKDATDQLRALHSVSITIVDRERVDDVYVVTARASLPNGRTDEEIGAVPTKGLSGDALANALMKAQTKAKRRVTLSICGLGVLDETELETIPSVRPDMEMDQAGPPDAVKGQRFNAEPVDEPGGEAELRAASVQHKAKKTPREYYAELGQIALDHGHPEWVTQLAIDAPDDYIVEKGKELKTKLQEEGLV